MRVETARLIIDEIRPEDKEDYFGISRSADLQSRHDSALRQFINETPHGGIVNKERRNTK